VIAKEEKDMQGNGEKSYQNTSTASGKHLISAAWRGCCRKAQSWQVPRPWLSG